MRSIKEIIFQIVYVNTARGVRSTAKLCEKAHKMPDGVPKCADLPATVCQ